jgi:hypothetical protein
MKDQRTCTDFPNVDSKNDKVLISKQANKLNELKIVANLPLLKYNDLLLLNQNNSNVK